jgi:4-amino-4-deoxy-L-arabinose transferase-like glycosyltransferase
VTSISRYLATPGRQFAALALLLTLARVAALVAGHADLGPDEGQYWFWGKTPAFGYFSKPPVIAWSIAATTGLFGDAEWAVRLAAPLYHLGAAVFLFLLTRKIAGPREALWAGMAWLTLPGVFLSSALITTDAPLIFFWSAALYYFFQLTDACAPQHPRRMALLLGAAVGFGLLSKYAMSYFLMGAALALVFSPARRRALTLANAGAAFLVALVLIAPNIWWNAQNDFQTISHTAANADWSGDFGHPGQLLNFLGAQFGVAGPIMLALIFLAALFGRRGPSTKERDTLQTLLAFSIPAMAIVIVQAFISRAHGNWAAVAYPSAIVMAVIWAFRERRTLTALCASLALHLIIGTGFLAVFASPMLADATGASRAFKRLHGWSDLGRRVADASLAYDAIMTDDREITGELVYYARGAKPIVAWNANARVDNHFEAFYGFDPERRQRLLYVTENAEALYIQGRFRSIQPLGPIKTRIGPGRMRTLYLFDVSGYQAPES